MPQAGSTCAILRGVRRGVSVYVEVARLLRILRLLAPPMMAPCKIGRVNCATERQTCIIGVLLPGVGDTAHVYRDETHAEAWVTWVKGRPD